MFDFEPLPLIKTNLKPTIEFLKQMPEHFNGWENEYYKKIKTGEEVILLKVLTAYLKRTPTIEDYKRCQMIYRAGIDDQYTFCYDNFPIGYVKRSFENLSYNIKFTPKNE